MISNCGNQIIENLKRTNKTLTWVKIILLFVIISSLAVILFCFIVATWKGTNFSVELTTFIERFDFSDLLHYFLMFAIFQRINMLVSSREDLELMRKGCHQKVESKAGLNDLKLWLSNNNPKTKIEEQSDSLSFDLNKTHRLVIQKSREQEDYSTYQVFTQPRRRSFPFAKALVKGSQLELNYNEVRRYTNILRAL